VNTVIDEVSNELIIDVTPKEIVIALLENKELVELSKEANNTKFNVGDIYLGKVKKIMPGLNAAFIEVGYERDAFLHYHDLGPQFQTQQEYLTLSINHKNNLTPISKIEMKNDIDKDGKITDVIAAGQNILVQIAKEPISTKGPRLSSEISIPGRNLVLMPFSDKISVSQKIKSTEERKRLKRLIESIKPSNYGVIVRTVAKNKRVAELDSELRGLLDKWEFALKQLREAQAPRLVHGELDRTNAILRDALNASYSNVYINDDAVYNDIRSYIEKIAPEKQQIVKHYTGRVPIFEKFGINKQIKQLFGKTVSIKSGVYLIIEHTEALHAIDVNSGNRSKKSLDQETNALEVNLIAAAEIARQLRLRDMGGIIVVDFIDMQQQENKLKVFEQMKASMSADRTKHNILPLSKFGLMQITRQRVRPEMNIATKENCPVCAGTGEIRPSILLEDDIEARIKKIFSSTEFKTVTILTHPYIAAYLTKGFFSISRKWSLKYKRLIKVKAESTFAFLEFIICDNKGEQIKL